MGAHNTIPKKSQKMSGNLFYIIACLPCLVFVKAYRRQLEVSILIRLKTENLQQDYFDFMILTMTDQLLNLK